MPGVDRTFAPFRRHHDRRATRRLDQIDRRVEKVEVVEIDVEVHDQITGGGQQARP